jgi:hypothetical protein
MGLVGGCCECGDEPLGCGATYLLLVTDQLLFLFHLTLYMKCKVGKVYYSNVLLFCSLASFKIQKKILV